MVTLLNYYNVSLHNLQSLTASQKKFQYLNSNKLLYTISFIYGTFADFLSVRSYVITVDYDRYFILKYCLFESNQRTSMPYIYFTCMTK